MIISFRTWLCEATVATVLVQVEMQRTAKAKAKELDKMYQEHQKVFATWG
jgi:hypothetical protein